MALVASVHVDSGWSLPDMVLSDLAGCDVRLTELAGSEGLLVVFTCNHCPYALAVWPRLIRHAAELAAMGIQTVAINPNIHPDYPADSVAAMQEKVAEWGIAFPYLADPTQTVARAFEAQCTPDIYMFDRHGRLYYHGRIDDAWKDEAKVTRQELLMAAELMISGENPPSPQHPTIGCSIKWKEA
ncbi:thioredoxin family protein [Mariprofundus erugo]|uniref:Thioredoxin family protein n=1 Tax=Mariprofundus erugo TaxID=2528639 RepID=A0A5R9GN11_9PROT|nr:thioredoxin family protein [Mariprofundus erugo]TLS65677.1 thioredoxin family protein [Mariprofundus erugo]